MSDRSTTLHIAFTRPQRAIGTQRPARAESKQGQDDTERSDVSVCRHEYSIMSMELIVMDIKSFTKHWNFEIVRDSTSSKSVNGLVRRLSGNKSTYDSANYHKSSVSSLLLAHHTQRMRVHSLVLLRMLVSGHVGALWPNH